MIHKIHMPIIKVKIHLYYLGSSLHYLQRYQEAIKMYDKAIELNQ